MNTDHSTKCRIQRSLLLLAGLVLSATTSAHGSNSNARAAGNAENGDPATKANRPADPREDNEIDLLKAQLAAQQQELNALRQAVEDQGKLLALVLKTNASSTTAPVSSPAAASDTNQLTGRATPPPEEQRSATRAEPLPRSSQANPSRGETVATVIQDRHGPPHAVWVY